MKRVLVYLAMGLFLALAVSLSFRSNPLGKQNSNSRERAGIDPAVRTQGPGAAVAARQEPIPAAQPQAPPNRAGLKSAGLPPRKRAWDEQFLVGLGSATEGDPIRFELVGRWASGTIRHLEHAKGELIYVSGQLTEPEAGRFFFQKQTLPGVAGRFVGVVELPASQTAYRLEPTGPGGSPELVERPLGGVICQRLPLPAGELTNQVEEIPPLKPGDFPSVPIPPYQKGIVVLESLPGAQQVIYLDFQGGYTVTWGGIAYDRPVVSNSQIRDVWVRVAEDYMPFNIDVTTDLGVYQNAPENSRQRVIITPTSTAAPGAGGVAYIGSFNWTGDTPCWVFITSGKSCAEACSHEAGHTVGLSHDGQDVNGTHTEYYQGQGSGTTGWAPIMGVGYYQNVSQWSKGEYANANNLQDQLAIITSQNNNVTYRADDTGDTLATSRYLEISTNYAVSAQGVIETTGDTDAFQFTTSGGLVSLRADPVTAGPNLALAVSLYDDSDNLLLNAAPAGTLYAALSTNLPAGTYTFHVTGIGRGNPVTSGFSDYASLGYYAISGSITNARLPSRFSIGENTPNGTILGTLGVVNPDSDPLTFTITAGNPGGTFALDNTGTLSVSDNSLLDYEALARNTQLPVEFEMFVDIADPRNPAVAETNRRVVVAVTNVNEPPTISGFAASALEHSQPGAILGTVAASDPDFYTLLSYSIVDGDSNGVFRIDQSGSIAVAGDLNAAVQNVYSLSVAVSDQTPPQPLMATSIVTVTVVGNPTPFQPGTISYDVYTNLSGNLVSALTSSPHFPFDPAWEKQLLLFEGDTDRGDNYGAVIRGYLLPPASGSYTFWLASDDNGELWLSGTTNPAGMTRIAYISGDGNWAGPREWDKFSTQKSAPVSLAAGQAYYIEARMKEGSGNDNLAVAWESADAGIEQEVIPGRYLAPFYLNYVPHAAGFTTALHRDAIAGSRLGVVRVTDVNSSDLETLSITGGNPNGIFELEPDTGILRMVDEAALLSAPPTTYTLQIRVTDNGSPPRFGTTNVVVKIVETNAIVATSIRQEIWTNIGSSTAVSALTGNGRYPKRPDTLRPLTTFDSGDQNFGDNYGSRIRGLLTPVTTGTYRFFIASDDNGQLRLSTNADPAGATVIASVGGATAYQNWSTYASQRSVPVPLVAGQKYYLEALHKEAGGDDFVSVGWTGPGLSGTNVIGSAFLTPVDLEFVPVLTARSTSVSLDATNGSIVAYLAASDSSLDFLAYKIVSGNMSNTFAIDVDNGTVAVADNTLLSSYGALDFNLVIQVQDSGYGGLYPLKSSFTPIDVQVLDQTVPAVWTGGGGDANWSTSNNWSTLPRDGQKVTFAGPFGQTNHNDLLDRIGPIVINAGGFAIAGNPLLLLAGLTSTGDNTWDIASTLNRSLGITNLSGTLVLGPVDNLGHLLSLNANGPMRLAGAILGSGGLEFSGSGPFTLATVNSFTGPTLLHSGVVSLASSAGLAASSRITIQPGAVLDASALGQPFVIPAGQTLVNQGRLSGIAFIGGQLTGGTLQPAGFDSLILQGQTFLALSKTGAGLTNDSVLASGSLVYGGSLVLTNLGDRLNWGDHFTLFSATAFIGSFNQMTLPPLDANLGWDASHLNRDGTLEVIAAPQIPIIPVGLGEGKLTLELQSIAGLNYALEFTVDLTHPSSWTAISTNVGPGGPLTFVVPVDPTQPQSFYRVRIF